MSLSNDTELGYLRSLVESMAEGVFITNHSGHIVQHNSAFREMLYTGLNLVGLSAAEVIHSAPLHEAVHAACTRSQMSRLEVTLEGLRPRVLQVSVIPIQSEQVASAAVFYDVTELRRLENIRKDFVANVSHELRTPITAIRGYAETLLDGALRDNDNAPQMVQIILKQAERLSALVEDLLVLSRIEARQYHLELKNIALLPALTRATEVVRQLAEAKNIRVSLSAPDNLNVLADERAIDQVLVNLIDNAVKYTPNGREVAVTATSNGAYVDVRIKDSGIGIDAKHLPRIFERFYRVDKGRSRDMGGTGLGLSIVKNLVTAMKGEVGVESIVGQGSTFSLRLSRA